MVVRRERGFTFVEVLATLLVVAIGLAGVVGLVAYGNRLSSRAQGEAVAMATAISLVHDPQPRLDPAVATEWSYTPYDFDNAAATQTSTAAGFMNGLYVTRAETSTVADIIARSPVDNHVYARSAQVEVTVYETIGGAIVAAYASRIVRQRNAP